MSTRNIKAGGAFVEISADDSKAMRALRNVQNRLKAFGQASQRIGQQMVVTGAVAGASLLPVVTILSSFKSELSAVAAVSGASAEQMQKLEAKARQLGATTSFTASQVAEAMKYLGMAGFSTDQIEASIQDVLNLARAGNIELGQAADIASDVGQAFGLSADEIKRVSDVMATAASKSNTTIFTLGETFKYAAPLAAAAGQSIETTAAATGVLGNNGIKATMAGTDLALIFKKLAESGMQKTFRDLGVETVTADGRIRDLVDIMSELDGAISHMTAAERLNWMATNFDRAAKSAQILSSQSAQFRNLADATNNAAGAGQKMADIMADNIGGRIMEMLSALESAVIDLGEALTPLLVPIMQDLTVFLGQLGEWITENQDLIQQLTNGVILATQFGAGLYAIGTAAGVAGTAISLMTTNVTGLAAAGGAAAASTASLSLAFGGLIAIAGMAAIGLYNGTTEIIEYNYAVQQAIELNRELAGRQRTAYEETMKQASAIDNAADKHKFLKEQIEKHNREIQGMESAVKGAKDEVDRLNTTWNWATGNKILEEANGELKNHQTRLKEANKHAAALRKELELLEKSGSGETVPGTRHVELDPEAVARESSEKSAQESFAKTIEDMTKTPMEKFEEFIEELTQALNRDDITEEQFNRAYEMKRQETMKALESEVEDHPMQDFADQIKEQMKTPLEIFEERMKQANAALDAGLVDEETVNRYRAEELKNLDKSLNMEGKTKSAQTQTNNALDIRSGEGLSSILQAAFKPSGSQEAKNGQHLANISTQMLQNNQVLAQVYRVLRDAKIIPETKMSGGAASA